MRLRVPVLVLLSLFAGVVAGSAQTGSTSDPFVQVTSVSTLDDDLIVGIEWDSAAALPVSATLVVKTSGGVSRASQAVTPAAGASQVQLVNVLGASDIGQTLTASVVDSSGDALAALPFDLVLDCATSYDCSLRARPGSGATADVPVVSPALAAEMTVSAQKPPSMRLSPHVLGDVLARRPDLTGEVYTYGRKLETLVLTPPEPPVPAAECLCFWEVFNNQAPSGSTDHSHDADPAFYDGKQGPGAAHWVKAWYDGGLFSATHNAETYVEGETETTMRLRCLRISGWVEVVIRLFGIEIRIRLPIIEEECPKPCVGTVANRGEFYADVKAWVDTGAWGDGQAAAQEEGRYSVNGTAVINRIARVGKEVRKSWDFALAIPGLGTVTTDNGTVTYDGPTDDTKLKIEINYEVNGNDGTISNAIVSTGNVTVNEPATALFEGKGLAYALGSSDSEAEGKATMSYMYAMFGTAVCARPQNALMWNYYSYAGRTQQLQTNIKNFFAQFGQIVEP